MAENPYAKYANPYAGMVPVGVDPTKPLDIQGKRLGNTRTQQEIDQANATAAANTARAKAEAIKAELDAKTAQEAWNTAHPKGTNATVLGPDSLKSLSIPDQELVKALADGRLAFPSGFALKAPWWQQKLEQVAAYDPTFDATNYNNRAKARAALTNGKLGTSANALNTAIGHVALLSSQIPGTASHDFTPLNAVENWGSQLFGSSGITNFKDTAQKLASELTSVYRNGGGAEADVVRQLESLDPNASAEQKQGIIRNAMELLASKQAANLYQLTLGTGGKPDIDLLDPAARKVLDQFPDIRDKYFTGPPPPLSQAAAALLTQNGGTAPPPPPPGAAPPPSGPPSIGPQGAQGMDYSGMVGAPQAALATQSYRNEYDPVMANAVSAFIKKGVPYQTVAEYAQSHGFNAPDPNAYSQAVAFAQQHHGATNVSANRSVPTTLGERLSASPAAAAIVGSGTGMTAGLSDVAGRALAGPSWDANRAALAATNPVADTVGNIAGGVAGAVAAPEALARVAPGASDALTAFRQAHPIAAPVLGDAAYGGVYGASENPNNPIGGAVAGALTGAATGGVVRGTTRGVSNVLSPTVGEFGPLYEAGVFPTPGQRFAKSGMFGRALNLTEQAMQSFPILGAAPASARQASRDAFQTGAFNNSLKELSPFQQIDGTNVSTSLPSNIGPGTNAHAFASGQFDNAYDAARAGMRFVPDQQYMADANTLGSKINNGILSPDQAQQVKNVVDNAVVGRLKAQGGALNGDAYKAASSDLNRAIQTWGKNPNTAPMADALSDYASIFDDAARRNSDPQAVNLLDSADKGYAQLVRIQRASQLGGAAKDAGTFTPTNYAAASKQMGGGVRSSAWNTGNALGQDYAQAGLNLSDKLADSGTPMRLGVLGALQGAEGVGLAATGHAGMFANPLTAAPFVPFLPGVREVVNRAIAPNAQRLRALPRVASALDVTADKLDNLAPFLGQAALPGSLAYYFGS